MAVHGKIVLCISLSILPWVTRPSYAEPVQLGEAAAISAVGGEVSVAFEGSEAAYDLRLYQSNADSQGPFFPNHATPVGTSRSLGIFLPGTELAFMLDVVTTGYRFFTGPASANPDGVVHAIAEEFTGTPVIPMSGVRVAFEDLLGGGDGDFNDFSFVVSNVALKSSSPVPEPSTLLLVGTGIAAAVRARQRRRKAGSTS